MKTFKKIILDDLKNQKRMDIAKKITTIRYRSFAGGDAVDVKAVNLNKEQRDVLESILRQYQKGKFDGMYDIYNYDEVKSTKERTAKYVHLQHEFSNDVREWAIEKLKNEWEIFDDKSAQEKRGCWFEEAIYRELRELTKIPGEA
jgi:hypothetical protein